MLSFLCKLLRWSPVIVLVIGGFFVWDMWPSDELQHPSIGGIANRLSAYISAILTGIGVGVAAWVLHWLHEKIYASGDCACYR